MLLAICKTQVRKRVKKRFKKEEKIRFTKNFLQGNSNLDPENQLELKVDTSIH